tara:strand:- start:8931 stop:9434 length:504 start_codon:yes stop_codon:yes gene_type:complete
MPAVRVNIRLRTVDAYIKEKHGRYRSINPAEQNVVNRYAERMIRKIRNNWPIDTGTSWGKWQWMVNPTPGQTMLIIENPMDYTTYVHPAGTSPNPSTAGSLSSSYAGRQLQAAFNEVKHPLNVALKREIDRTEARTRKATTEPATRPWSLAERLRLISEARRTGSGL